MYTIYTCIQIYNKSNKILQSTGLKPVENETEHYKVVFKPEL